MEISTSSQEVEVPGSPLLSYQIQKQVHLFNGTKAEKTSQTSGFQLQIKKRDFSANVAFWNKKGLLNCQRPNPKPPSRDLARTVYTAENLFFTSFLQRHKQWFLG